MDIMAVLRYVSDHIEQVIGGLVVLFLLTSILLLIRNIGQKEDSTASKGRSTADDLDIGAIETAMKRVLAAQGVSAVGASVGSQSGEASGDGGVPAHLTEALRERDTKVQELAREIDRLTLEVSAQGASGGAGQAGSDSSGKVAELQTKIDELQARLTEYEIIEDDIADLSLFKEENAQLKQELERLKSESGSGGTSAAVASARPVDTSTTLSEPESSDVSQSAEDAIAALGIEFPTAGSGSTIEDIVADDVPVVAPSKSSSGSAESQQIVPQDEIDALFALAPVEEAPVSVFPDRSRSPVTVTETADTIELSPEETPSVFGDALDTEKMLDEVASLSETAGDDESVLDSNLDTDKLLAEMTSTEMTTPVAVAPTAALNSAQPSSLPLVDLEEEPAGEDDLLAEFKEPNDGGQS